ncbi:Hypothetical protein NCDO2118_1817 [Lactococcus lactis subsp. lactis NCDO 2118]|uniref:ABC transporter domain-containing protein n=1 Tax=Lactococcus lactis subsp. lactis NCDO 2118 TaxID=1117941 RepID=A0ABC8A7V1_LACLL|nr:ABC transporter ATP-binding protein [Lactococcus lactis]ADA65454.1 ABC-2 type transporter, ATP-binding protein [Lactococcus lactis subsp. lactis KF147]AII13272.1 Hypothetical protein NCDO2118_1817 [Lactococcus lactis subsp. lactis NCDO 2118]
MKEIIKVAHLSKSFEDNPIIKDISFSVNEGGIFIILGKNGAGKTTLIKMLLHILAQDSGEIDYYGQAIDTYGQKLYEMTSAVLENAENTYGYLTALENIEYFAALYKRKIKKQEILQLLEQFDLAEAANKRVFNFSRGMKQKLSIICSLLNDAKILFLDEPTLGLDFKANRDLLDMVKKMSKEHNKTIILTTHQTDVIKALADRVLLLNKGEISFLGKYESFIQENSLVYYLINTNTESYQLTDEKLAEEKLKKLIEDGERIIYYEKHDRSIEEILIDYYKGGENV